MIESPLEGATGTYALAIHTASPELGLAIRKIDNGSEEGRSHTWPLGRDTSTHLHGYLHEFLSPQQWHDLAFIAVAKGPGGFTGTRIGVVTARTLAQQLDIPLFAVSTLNACAWAAVRTGTLDPAETDLAVEMTARRGDVFGAIYHVKTKDAGMLETAMAETVMPKPQWRQVLDDWKTPGNVPCPLIHGDGNLGWTVPYLLELADQRWQQGDRPPWPDALPFYGQSPV